MMRDNKSAFMENDCESVIAACIKGNQMAQRTLYKKFYGYSKSICLRYTSFTEDADEVLNEGFLKVFNNLKNYDSTYPFKAWLRTIMINTAISYYRKNKKHNDERVALEDVPNIGFEEDIVSRITADEILELVRQLPQVYKNVFLMHAVDGYNHREIAELLMLNEATVRSQFVRARARLKLMIKMHYPHLVPDEFKFELVNRHEAA